MQAEEGGLTNMAEMESFAKVFSDEDDLSEQYESKMQYTWKQIGSKTYSDTTAWQNIDRRSWET